MTQESEDLNLERDAAPKPHTEEGVGGEHSNQDSGLVKHTFDTSSKLEEIDRSDKPKDTPPNSFILEDSAEPSNTKDKTGDPASEKDPLPDSPILQGSFGGLDSMVDVTVGSESGKDTLPKTSIPERIGGEPKDFDLERDHFLNSAILQDISLQPNTVVSKDSPLAMSNQKGTRNEPESAGSASTKDKTEVPEATESDESTSETQKSLAEKISLEPNRVVSKDSPLVMPNQKGIRDEPDSAGSDSTKDKTEIAEATDGAESTSETQKSLVEKLGLELNRVVSKDSPLVMPNQKGTRDEPESIGSDSTKNKTEVPLVTPNQKGTRDEPESAGSGSTKDKIEVFEATEGAESTSETQKSLVEKIGLEPNGVVSKDSPLVISYQKDTRDEPESVGSDSTKDKTEVPLDMPNQKGTMDEPESIGSDSTKDKTEIAEATEAAESTSEAQNTLVEKTDKFDSGEVNLPNSSTLEGSSGDLNDTDILLNSSNLEGTNGNLNNVTDNTVNSNLERDPNSSFLENLSKQPDGMKDKTEDFDLEVDTLPKSAVLESTSDRRNSTDEKTDVFGSGMEKMSPSLLESTSKIETTETTPESFNLESSNGQLSSITHELEDSILERERERDILLNSDVLKGDSGESNKEIDTTKDSGLKGHTPLDSSNQNMASDEPESPKENTENLDSAGDSLPESPFLENPKGELNYEKDTPPVDLVKDSLPNLSALENISNDGGDSLTSSSVVATKVGEPKDIEDKNENSVLEKDTLPNPTVLENPSESSISVVDNVEDPTVERHTLQKPSMLESISEDPNNLRDKNEDSGSTKDTHPNSPVLESSSAAPNIALGNIEGSHLGTDTSSKPSVLESTSNDASFQNLPNSIVLESTIGEAKNKEDNNEDSGSGKEPIFESAPLEDTHEEPVLGKDTLTTPPVLESTSYSHNKLEETTEGSGSKESNLSNSLAPDGTFGELNNGADEISPSDLTKEPLVVSSSTNGELSSIKEVSESSDSGKDTLLVTTTAGSISDEPSIMRDKTEFSEVEKDTLPNLSVQDKNEVSGSGDDSPSILEDTVGELTNLAELAKDTEAVKDALPELNGGSDSGKDTLSNTPILEEAKDILDKNADSNSENGTPLIPPSLEGSSADLTNIINKAGDSVPGGSIIAMENTTDSDLEKVAESSDTGKDTLLVTTTAGSSSDEPGIMRDKTEYSEVEKDTLPNLSLQDKSEVSGSGDDTLPNPSILEATVEELTNLTEITKDTEAAKHAPLEPSVEEANSDSGLFKDTLTDSSVLEEPKDILDKTADSDSEKGTALIPPSLEGTNADLTNVINEAGESVPEGSIIAMENTTSSDLEKVAESSVLEKDTLPNSFILEDTMSDTLLDSSIVYGDIGEPVGVMDNTTASHSKDDALPNSLGSNDKTPDSSYQELIVADPMSVIGDTAYTGLENDTLPSPAIVEGTSGGHIDGTPSAEEFGVGKDKLPIFLESISREHSKTSYQPEDSDQEEGALPKPCTFEDPIDSSIPGNTVGEPDSITNNSTDHPKHSVKEGIIGELNSAPNNTDEFELGKDPLPYPSVSESIFSEHNSTRYHHPDPDTKKVTLPDNSVLENTNEEANSTRDNTGDADLGKNSVSSLSTLEGTIDPLSASSISESITAKPMSVDDTNSYSESDADPSILEGHRETLPAPSISDSIIAKPLTDSENDVPPNSSAEENSSEEFNYATYTPEEFEDISEPSNLESTNPESNNTSHDTADPVSVIHNDGDSDLEDDILPDSSMLGQDIEEPVSLVDNTADPESDNYTLPILSLEDYESERDTLLNSSILEGNAEGPGSTEDDTESIGEDSFPKLFYMKEPSEVGVGTECYTCSSAEDEKCLTNPSKSSAKACKDPNDTCAWQIVDGVLHRGCKGTFSNLRVVEGISGECSGSFCNNAHIGGTRLGCHQCKGPECLMSPGKIQLCKNYKAGGKCFIDVIDETTVTRGCMSDKINCAGKFCQKCDKFGCNNQAGKTRFQCASCRSDDTNDCIRLDTPPNPNATQTPGDICLVNNEVFCHHDTLFGHPQKCFTYHELDVVIRGCSKDMPKKIRGNKNIVECFGDNCNRDCIKNVRCAVCDSRVDPKCKNDVEHLELQECPPELSSCHTCDDDNGTIIRGCGASSENSNLKCNFCQDKDGCNAERKPVSCYTCNSRYDPNCAQWTHESKVEECPHPDDQCIWKIAAEYTIRGCSSRVRDCSDGDPACGSCREDKCNGGIKPENRLQCHHCEGSECVHKVGSKVPCEHYKPWDKCFTGIIDENNVVRGCMSDKVDRCLSLEKCYICSGTGCNRSPFTVPFFRKRH